MYTVLRNIEYGDDVTMDHAPCTIDHGIQNLQLYTAVVPSVTSCCILLRSRTHL